MKVFFHTLGCKVNHYETQEMLETLYKKGYQIVTDAKEADVIVINSCTVTAESDRKSRQAVRHYRKLNDNAITVLTGCMPQAYSDKSSLLEEADIILGNKTNSLLDEAIKQFISNKETVINVQPHLNNETLISTGISHFEERTRAYLKIEDGCNRFCSYCAIPYARGRVRSKPIEEIVSEAEQLAENDFVEIVLVGINLSAYGTDLKNVDFPSAVKAVADIEKVKRVRLGSLEPDHLTDEVIEKLSKIEKLCPQFHISLQSGCNNTLKRMNRHYTAEEYLSLCNKLRSTFNNCTLTTDIMVGFSGETDEDFNETVEFVKKIGFEKVHIFPYSVREGTRAASFENRIPNKVKNERAKLLNDVCSEIRSDFLKKQIRKEYDILIEKTLDNGSLFGYTDNYIPVIINSSSNNKNGKYLIKDSDSEYCYA
ncbi:MAG: tRNA (N(6)-L-threonylcarbamoyladenosine(37)-C(2))-methylthiotransferase MtaB [Ruminococcaceae bacterium]|jgi:threonylcarbamoyladenosine tRNA methylthiotransferase MtaB|nr:tRNA (N(6)-L-threonylcarbamoyladenosine(37)-C(2))-methylthiotransferase MtaB [Oscillospiraceae bacterium]